MIIIDGGLYRAQTNYDCLKRNLPYVTGNNQQMCWGRERLGNGVQMKINYQLFVAHELCEEIKFYDNFYALHSIDLQT